MLYRFNAFELDASQYRLTRELPVIHVKPKVLELLVYLVERRDRVVAKEELLSTLWEGRFVSEGVLAEAIHEARRAFGEDAGRDAFIRTVHGRGYQFVCQPVEIVTSGHPKIEAGAASLWLDWSGGLTALWQGENFIGRDASCLIVLVGSRVSRRHARVDVSATAAVLHDLGSKNGTAVNGERVSSPRPLHDGDVIEIGGTSLTVRERRSDASTLTSAGTGAG